MNNMSQQAFMQNNQIMAAFNPSVNGVGTPPTNGNHGSAGGAAGSPRMGPPNHSQPMPNGVSTHVATIEAQIRARNPTATPEQIHRMVQESLSKTIQHQQQQRQQLSQSAMHAAAGGGTPTPMPAGIQNSPQQYAQLLRLQQQAQAQQSQQSRNPSAGPPPGSRDGSESKVPSSQDFAKHVQ